MKTSTWGLLMAGALLAGAAQAAPFTNGSFETATTHPGATSFNNFADAGVAGWTVTGGTVDYIANGYWNASHEQYSLDMSGTSAGTIQQQFDTVAGRTYAVSFDMAGNPDGGAITVELEVSATGGSAQTYEFDTTGHSRPGNMGWEPRRYVFTATSNATTLTFRSLTAGNRGAALDNVAVTDITPAPVPTLSQWALFGLAGLLGLAALRRRGLSR